MIANSKYKRINIFVYPFFYAINERGFRALSGVFVPAIRYIFSLPIGKKKDAATIGARKQTNGMFINFNNSF